MYTTHAYSRVVALLGLITLFVVVLTACAAPGEADRAQPANFAGPETPSGNLFVEGEEQPRLVVVATPTAAPADEGGELELERFYSEVFERYREDFEIVPFDPYPLPTLAELEAEPKELLLTPVRENTGVVCDNGMDFILPNVFAGEIDPNPTMCAAFWDYDLRNLPPDSKIAQASLNLGSCFQYGDPFSQHDNLFVQWVRYDTLDSGDYGPTGMRLADVRHCPTHLNVTLPIQMLAQSGQADPFRFQVKAQFFSPHPDGVSEFIAYEVEAGSLIIQYY